MEQLLLSHGILLSIFFWLLRNNGTVNIGNGACREKAVSRHTACIKVFAHHNNTAWGGGGGGESTQLHKNGMTQSGMLC